MSIPQAWPEHLDAVIAAPRHHRILFENEAVRVLDTRVAPGETVPLHTHCHPASSYLLAWSHFIRRDGDGKVLLDSRTMPSPDPGSAFWADSMPPHTLENVGEDDLHVISVELKHLA